MKPAPRYAPYPAARDLPNVVVDGAPLPSTVLTLSHWPNNRSPAAFRRDTSTATVFAWLDALPSRVPAPWVTTNHFDEDGLFSMYALSQPESAQAYRQLLIDASFAGDFGVVRSRDAARLCFIIEALSDPEVSTLPAAVFAEPDRVAALYRALLPRLPALLEQVAGGAEGCRDLWAAEEAHLEASTRLLADGRVALEERHGLDLAILRIPIGLPARPSRRYLQSRAGPLHPYAINTATACSRLLLVQGPHYVFEYRYESWVQLASRRVPLRVRLDGLASQLDGLESGPPGWVAEDAAEVAPRLWRPDGSPSTLDAATFLDALALALTSAPVAWDPYDWSGAKCA